MQFNYFHLMPWTDIEETDKDWPVPNRAFVPERATGLYNTYMDTMAYAEECGFDWIGCNEHHFSPYGLMSNCNLVGAVLIQKTKTARIAMLGNLVPLLNPLRVAEEYAMLDVMSGGRLIAGFMRGIPHEYVAYNIPPNESWARLEEATELIIKAWTEPEPFGWEGKFYKYRAVSIWPRPIQQPHPPILMSASSPESARFAAKHHAKMGMVMLTDLDMARDCIRIYKETAREYGWEPAVDDILVGAHTFVDEDPEVAKKYLGDGLEYFYHVLFGGPRTAQRLVVQGTRYYEEDANRERLAARLASLRQTSINERIENHMVLCGTPDMVIDQIKALHDELGHGVMNINMKIGNIPDDAVLSSMKLWGEHVAPEVRSL
ncbi:MAG: LLM class flavin-dependent oxidoreductase [Rhodospirillales bacterium]|nr:LLM class flavin-dependent oxidoreductase [Rhodospirillales bacterium]